MILLLLCTLVLCLNELTVNKRMFVNVTWTEIIQIIRYTVYSKLIKLGYKSSYIGAVLEQYESAYGYKRYDFDEIKAMIDRMAKPEQPRMDYNHQKKGSFAAEVEAESKTKSSSDSKSTTSPIGVNMPNGTRMNMNMNIQPLAEDKSFSFNDNNQNKQPFKVNATYKKSLSEEDYQTWSTNDILLWMKSIENGLISKGYPKVMKRIKDLNRALIMEAIAGL